MWDTWSRVITPGGTPSPLLNWEPTEEQILRSMLDVRVDQATPIELGEGQTARAVAAAASRERWRPHAGDRVDEMSDSEMMDSLDYTLFPNMHPWGAFNRIVYRFRPNGDDHRSAIMEVFFLSPFQGERPPPAPVHELGEDDPWIDAPELGVLAKVFEQDTFNMCNIQLGLETTFKPGITLANYQESKVRWLHDLLGKWVEDDDGRRRGWHAGVRAMKGIVHPFSRALYEQDGAGHIRVTLDGRHGDVRRRRPLAGRRAARLRPPAVRLGRWPADRQPPHGDDRQGPRRGAGHAAVGLTPVGRCSTS